MDIFDQVIPTPNISDPERSRFLETRIVRTSEGDEKVPDPDEYTDGACPPPKIYRDATGRFLPGTDGGKGRPPSFGWLVRKASAEGVELAAFAFGLLRGEVKNTITGVSRVTGELWTEEVECSAALKFEVLKWLKDNGFGKEASRFDVTSNGETVGQAPGVVEDCPDLSKLTTEEVRQYLQLRRKAQMASKIVEGIVVSGA